MDIITIVYLFNTTNIYINLTDAEIETMNYHGHDHEHLHSTEVVKSFLKTLNLEHIPHVSIEIIIIKVI